MTRRLKHCEPFKTMRAETAANYREIRRQNPELARALFRGVQVMRRMMFTGPSLGEILNESRTVH